MDSPSDEPEGRAAEPAKFKTTQWSLVLAAGHSAGPRAREALATLCRIYWYPLYAYVRRHGRDADAARDLTQAFFAELLEKNRIAAADPHRGRFRSWLLASMRNFLANARDRASARKRGGDSLQFSIDAQDAEQRYAWEPAHEITPERLFDPRWAIILLDQVWSRLHRQAQQEGKLEVFESLRPLVANEAGRGSYQDLAVRLGMSEGAIQVAVHRLRRRYRLLLRQEIERTLDPSEDIEDEIRHLFAAVT